MSHAAAGGPVQPQPVLDWAAPWLAPWRVAGQTVGARQGAGQPLHVALNAQADLGQAPPVRFVAQAPLRGPLAYESLIYQTGQCPVREGLHDFLNGLCWLQFPRTKRRLNQLQFEQIDRAGVGATRGPVRDAITLFDENAALLQCPDRLWQLLEDKDWHKLFVSQRALWQQARLVLFGHALLEKLAQPRAGITAHVVRVPMALQGQADIDTWLATHLSAAALARKPFAVLPVLGVPGWWPANEDPAFYGDAKVFRPPRHSAANAGSALAGDSPTPSRALP